MKCDCFSTCGLCERRWHASFCLANILKILNGFILNLTVNLWISKIFFPLKKCIFLCHVFMLNFMSTIKLYEIHDRYAHKIMNEVAKKRYRSNLTANFTHRHSICDDWLEIYVRLSLLVHWKFFLSFLI